MKAQEWNDRYPVGQSVYVTEDDGSLSVSQTRSKAWELGSGQAVISVDNRTGSYSLDRIKVR